MTMLFFGDPWDSPALDGALRVPVPVGEPCVFECGEPVAAGDRGFVWAAVAEVDGKLTARPAPAHVECVLRDVMGHDVGVCHHTGYGRDRPSARLVWERAQALQG